MIRRYNGDWMPLINYLKSKNLFYSLRQETIEVIVNDTHFFIQLNTPAVVSNHLPC